MTWIQNKSQSSIRSEDASAFSLGGHWVRDGKSVHRACHVAVLRGQRQLPGYVTAKKCRHCVVVWSQHGWRAWASPNVPEAQRRSTHARCCLLLMQLSQPLLWGCAAALHRLEACAMPNLTQLSHCPLMSLHICDNIVARGADRTFAVLIVMCTQNLPRSLITIYVEQDSTNRH